MARPSSDSAAGVELSDEPDEMPGRNGPQTSGPTREIIRWGAPALAAILISASLLRTGVGGDDLLRYSLYWGIAILVPGVVVSRSLLHARPTLLGDAAVAAATGISLEILSWLVGAYLGLGDVVRFWWIPVTVVGLMIPRLRRRIVRRVPARLPALHSVSLSALVVLVVLRLDVANYRKLPLPPQASVVYPDDWWQLALVQELMKYERPQVPQVAGKDLVYHYFANLHVASASRLSGVLPEVALFRLWLVPVVVVMIGLAFTLGRLLTSSWTAGVLGAWLAYGAILGTYLWPGLTSAIPATSPPVPFHSPSQIIANVGLMAGAVGIVQLLRLGTQWGLVAWTTLVLAGASGMKSTVIPILLAGTGLALARATLKRSAARRPLALVGALLVLLQLASLRIASGNSGGSVVLLGTLREIRVFADAVDDTSMRGLNSGLVLDSIDTGRAFVYALLALALFAGVHGVRLIGVVSLATQRGRDELTVWWLAGSVFAGYAAVMMIDHIGLSQNWFVYTAGQLGATLTVTALWAALPPHPGERRRTLVSGMVIGIGMVLAVDYIVDVRRAAGGYGLVDEVLVPAMLVAVAGVAGWLYGRRQGRKLGWAIALAAAIGAAIPATTSDAVRTAYRWLHPVEYVFDNPNNGVSRQELVAMSWLRDHSDESDVIATNLHCEPPPNTPNCNARGFWVVGLSGRRAVLEGWAYTAEANALQGVEGRLYAQQPAPFTERAAMNDAVFAGDVDALRSMVSEHGVSWLVAIHRAGPVPSFPDSIVTTRFVNSDVTIYEITFEP